MKEPLGLGCQSPVNLHSLRKQSAVTSVNVCYKYREPVISSLMTIYLVFCKSKAKYHMLCRHLLDGHQADSNASRLQGAAESREGWLHSAGFSYTVH